MSSTRTPARRSSDTSDGTSLLTRSTISPSAFFTRASKEACSRCWWVASTGVSVRLAIGISKAMAYCAAPPESRNRYARSIGPRLQKLAIGWLFAVVLLVPKVLNLRRDERSWTAFRILLGIAGAGLVILPLAFWNSWLAAIAGLTLFLTAALLPAARSTSTVDDKARELGALVVVNGGKYKPGSDAPAAAQLFVGADYIWVLDSHFEPLLTIPVSEISSVHAQGSGDQWIVHVRRAHQMEDRKSTRLNS